MKCLARYQVLFYGSTNGCEYDSLLVGVLVLSVSGFEPHVYFDALAYPDLLSLSLKEAVLTSQFFEKEHADQAPTHGRGLAA